MVIIKDFFSNPVVIVFLITTIGSAVVWLYRFTRDYEIRSEFIEEMATNHLPHLYVGQQMLYQTQRSIASSLGIELAEELPEPPVINFTKIRDKKKKRKFFSLIK